MCDILGLEAKPNNGSRDTYKDMFADDDGGNAITICLNMLLLILPILAVVDYWA